MPIWAATTLVIILGALIVCMALIEGSALFGGVVTLLGGGALPAVAGVLLIWSALAVAWPRRAWYGLR